MVDHEEIFNYFLEEARTHAGPALRTVVVYGSALTENFRPGVSDYNFLLVAEPIDVDLLKRLAARAGRWRKKRISVPLIVLPDFLQRARDAYPLELLSMQAKYRVLHGTDLLESLEIMPGDVRLQCEREIRSKIILFRRAFLETEGAPKRLKLIIDRGIPALVAIFRGLLYFKGGPWKAQGQEFWDACAQELGLPIDLLPELDEIRNRKAAPGQDEIHRQFGRILTGLMKLVEEIDQW